VAGLKVIDGRGELLDCNAGLVKNASGYDLRHLFIGSEGTLGMIVAVTLRLTNLPAPGKVMLLGISSLDALMKVFAVLRANLKLSARISDGSPMHGICQGRLSSPLAIDCPCMWSRIMP
jgi:FAD/FMN-containing dehydrogenase